MVVKDWEMGEVKMALPVSLIVIAAALQVFTLNITSAVVCAGELNTVLVNTPADTSFAATRWLALWRRKQ